MPNPIVHFEILGTNGAALQQYYADLFGWTIDADNPMKYGLVDTGAGEHALRGGIGDTDNGQPTTCFYVGVDDPQAYLDKATAAGGTMVVPVTEIPNMVTFAQFADPEGNVIGLVKTP
jgi:predicted enzyme related to lactoylglutathione lyase